MTCRSAGHDEMFLLTCMQVRQHELIEVMLMMLCLKLSHLYVGYQFQTDSEVGLVVANLSSLSLNTLGISRCEQMTDAGLAYLHHFV